MNLQLNSFRCDVSLACCLSVSLYQFLQPPDSPATHPYTSLHLKVHITYQKKVKSYFLSLKVPDSIGCHTAVLFYITVAHALFNKNLKWSLCVLSSSAVQFAGKSECKSIDSQNTVSGQQHHHLLVWNADSLLHARPTASEVPGEGPRNLHFNKFLK